MIFIAKMMEQGEQSEEDSKSFMIFPTTDQIGMCRSVYNRPRNSEYSNF